MSLNLQTVIRAAIFAVITTGGCATPVAPTGGPPDTTPPILISSVPEPNTVRFESDRITLSFSEPVDRATFHRALSFTPEIGLTPELMWHGESVDLVFRGPLRDNTTYILSLDNQLKDNRGVAVSRPITLAFSTGPTIDDGTINGRVVDPQNGAAVEGIDVFAYEGKWMTLLRSPAVETERENDDDIIPSYRTQTDAKGTFSFSNLPMRVFFVLAVEDRNRNRAPDSTEVIAMPSWGVQRPDTGFVTVSATPRAWFVDRSDVREPSVVEIRSLSSRRLEIRFSEPVRLDSLVPERWVVTDTLTAFKFDGVGVYQPLEYPNRIAVVTDSLHAGTFEITGAGVVRDSAGNTAEFEGVAFFLASTAPDTLQTRFVGFGPLPSVTPGLFELGAGMLPEVRFNEYIEPKKLMQLVKARTSQGWVAAVDLHSVDGTTWGLTVEPEIEAGDSLVVSVSGAGKVDTVYSATFAFLGSANTGHITGHFADSAKVVVQLFSAAPPFTEHKTITDQSGRFQLDRLLKGSYALRAFVDVDDDGDWTPGSLHPFQLPEPLMWHNELIDVRMGWESVVDTLSFVLP